MLQRFSPCTPPPNTCRGNGRIQANVIALFPFRSTSYLMPRRRDRGEKQSDLTLPPHRRRLPRRRISLTSRRLSAARFRKRTDKHALACKKRRSGKRANSCRKRRKHSVQTDKSTMFFEPRQVKTATQTRKTAVATRRERSTATFTTTIRTAILVQITDIISCMPQTAFPDPAALCKANLLP